MLRWLPKKLNKRQQLFFQLTIFSFCVHALGFAFYCFTSRQKVVALNMRTGIIDTETPIVVLPFVKSTGRLQMARTRRTKRVKQQIKTSKRITPRRPSSVQVAHINTPNKQVATNIAKTVPPVTQKLKVYTGKIKPVTHEKFTSEKILVKNIKHVQLVEPVQNISMAPVITQQPVFPTFATEKKEIQETEQEEQETIPNITDLVITEKLVQEENNPIILGREEYQMLQAYQSLHETITQNWQAPAGFQPKKECILLVNINNQGTVDTLTVEQSSGILAYDIAARMAVYQSIFPSELKKQSIRLHF